ncbi:hypothetical protein MASR1M12_24440 [Erysipelotrichia bacterium]|jgi:probable addiction module antidote protein
MNKTGRPRKTHKLQAAGHLKNREEMAVYLESCLCSAGTDACVVARALGDIARETGMSSIAKATGLSRENLYKALSGERNPTLETFLKVLGAAGLRLRIEPVLPPPRTRRRRPIRTVNIDGQDITFLPVSSRRYDELAAISRPFFPADTLAESLREFLARKHPEFDAPRLYAALKKNFGESVADYDDDECSFEYRFVLRLKKKNRTIRYLLRFNDRGNDFGIIFTRVGKPLYAGIQGDHAVLPVLIGEDLSEESMHDFVIWLVSFLVGYISACEKTFNSDFARSHKFRRTIYGFRDGVFFSETFDKRGFANACKAMARTGIPFNATTLPAAARRNP